jgi:hypothetical protein
MVQHSGARRYASFAALSDATRRGDLEQAGLVAAARVGRVRTCKLGARRLDEETAWIERHRQRWASRFDELDEVLEDLKRKEKADGRKKKQ